MYVVNRGLHRTHITLQILYFTWELCI